MKRLTLAAVVALAGLGACGQPGEATSAGPSGPAPAPQRLSDVVIGDPNFDFATTRTVRVELRAAPGTAPQAIELFDADGRRLIDGAFKPGATIDVRLPVGRAEKLKLRVGKGSGAVEQELAVDSGNHVVADI